MEPAIDANFGKKDNIDEILVEIHPGDRRVQIVTTKEIGQKTTPESSSINDFGPGENIFTDRKTETESFKNETMTVAETIAASWNQSTLQMYPSLEDMKSKILNGTFEWSKTARSILFLKKHKCASSTLRESLKNYLYWRGLTEENSIFQALGQGSTDQNEPVLRSSQLIKPT